MEAATTGYAQMIKSAVEGRVPINLPVKVGRKTRKIKRLTRKSSLFLPKRDKAVKPENIMKTKRGAGEKRSPEDPEKASTRTKQGAGERTSPEDPKNVSRKPPQTVLFIPYTPESLLTKSIQKGEDNMAKSAYGRVKVVETLGPGFKSWLGHHFLKCCVCSRLFELQISARRLVYPAHIIPN